MHKMNYNGEYYEINQNLKRRFLGNEIAKEKLQVVIDFAYEMCFGSGYHRTNRTGGKMYRKSAEQFCNTFQGKLAEVMLYDLLQINGISCNEPDFNVYGKGIWDDNDLVSNGRILSVKSAKFFSNLLLLEKGDYDSNGCYIPNNEVGKNNLIDYFILVRISPYVDKILKENNLHKSDKIKKELLYKLIIETQWCYDVVGWISHDDFVNEVIKGEFIISQGAKLNNNYTKMDADNYYVHSGDMHKIEELFKILKGK